MIKSPLEQFNILSIYDFSLAGIGHFEIVYAKILLLVSDLCYCLGASHPHGFAVGDGLAPNLFVGSIEWAYQTSIASSQPLANGITYLVHGPITQTNIYNIIDAMYEFYHTCATVHWHTLYADLNLLYSADHLFFTKLWDLWLARLYAPGGMIVVDDALNASEAALYKSALIEQNISFLTGSLSNLIAYINFIKTEFWIIITSFAYHSPIGHALKFSTKDFSYLIFSLNTSTIWLSLGFLFQTFLVTTILESITLLPKNNWQRLLESLYGIILGVVNENAGPKGLKQFPLIFTSFMIILICNLLGMIPYSFTVTSHLILTFSMGLALFVGLNIIGILKNGTHFISLFFPPGAPLALAPLLVFIELISYVFRVLSLSIRLFANLMSGHTLLKILSSFAWLAVSFWGIFLIPLLIIFLVTGLELAIACLQAYIFVVLVCIYINDAINLH